MAKRPRFCMISVFYPPYSFGGDAVYLSRLVSALARRGYEVDVVHCVDSYQVLNASGLSPEQDFPEHPTVTVHRLKSRWGWLSPLLSQQTGRPLLQGNAIRAVLQSKKFDVIHFHNISLFGPQVLTLTPDYSDFVKLYTMHEHWLVCPMHVLWKNNRRPCDRPTCFSCSLAFKRPPQWWRYTDLLSKSLDSVDAFIAPSRFTRDMHRQRGFRKPIEIIPHFVPAPAAHDAPADEPAHPRPYFLFVGRLEKIKGAQELIRVFRRYPHADLLVAGSGTYEGELRRLAVGMSNVVFLGQVPRHRLQTLYRNAIAVVMPSVGYETFGLIVIEAFAERTPVIVNALGALPEVVEESGGGFTYSKPDQLVEALERLRTNSELRRQLGEQGYQAYLERWGEEQHLKSYFGLLEATARRKLTYIPWEGSEETSRRLGSVLVR